MLEKLDNTAAIKKTDVIQAWTCQTLSRLLVFFSNFSFFFSDTGISIAVSIPLMRLSIRKNRFLSASNHAVLPLSEMREETFSI